MQALIKYDAACRAIAAAVKRDEIKKITDEAEQLRLYARQAKNKTLESQAVEIRFRAERRLGEIMQAQKQEYGFSRGGKPYQRGFTGSAQDPVRPATLKEAGIDKGLADRARKLAAIPAKEFEKLVGDHRKRVIEEGERITTSLAAAGLRAVKRKEKYGTMIEPGPIAGADFEDVYVDPPTRFEAGDNDRAAENHYPTMTYDELLAVLKPLEQITAKQCRLWIWTTGPWLAQTIDLIRALGFEYKSNLCWDKERHGTGYWFLNEHEQLLVATKGGAKAPDRKKVQLASSVLHERRTEHSRKPDAVRAIIERYFPRSKKLELFCRGAPAEGWHAWGNETQPAKGKATAADELAVLEAIAAGGESLIALAGREKLLTKLHAQKLVRGKGKPVLTRHGKDQIERLRQDVAREKLEAELPSTFAELVTNYRAALERRQQAILAGDEATIEGSSTLLDVISEKASKVKSGGWFEIAQATAAPLGEVPLWGQIGSFKLHVDGVQALVVADRYGELEAHALFGDEPFFTREGSEHLDHQGVLAWSWAKRGDVVNREILGKSVSDRAAERLQQAIRKARGKNGDKDLPRPDIWYREPKRAGEQHLKKAGGDHTHVVLRRERREKEKASLKQVIAGKARKANGRAAHA